ncbi:hypothetical protein [Actinomadura parmotrematis]|uniref:RNA polymerase subunit sigma-70 n=1 Tax=Actinomadura parmotrematis TaxID=2864039 RepID=A0ABS7FQR8_9ACTN|nr:hypothetical protein [Actinomadura parmotrematis]MBW8481902.1 hypothetical protein [Actinomadura parmotrematis]
MPEPPASQADYPHWFQMAWVSMDARTRDMLVRRHHDQTLEAIGRAHYLTRERARQVIRDAGQCLLVIAKSMEKTWCDQLDELFHDTVAVADHALTEIFPDPGGAARYALLHTLGYQHPRTWAGVQRAFWTREPKLLATLLGELAANAPYRPAELRFRATALGIPDALPIEEIASHGRSPLVQNDDGAWVRRNARGRDVAYLWLAEQGGPRTADEIADALGGEGRAVRESLRRDSRFRLIRPEGTWALTEWPHDETADYGTAIDAVLDVITELGPISKRRLIQEVQRRYPVSLSRVTQCLIDDRVGITADGRVDLVERGAAPLEDSEPTRPSHVALDAAGGILGFTLTIDADLLRGSGVIIHRWITWYLGLRQAPMTRAFDLTELIDPFAPATITTPLDPPGRLTITRNTSAAQISSLRVHATSMGLSRNCRLAVVLRLREGTAYLRHACHAEACPVRERLHPPTGSRTPSP